MDFIVRSGSLACKLVAGDIQNFQPLVVEFFINAFQILVLRCETASGSCIYNQNYLSSEFIDREEPSLFVTE